MKTLTSKRKWIAFLMIICALPLLVIACGDDDDDDIVEPDVPLPGRPTGLKAAGQGNSIVLTWAATPNAVRYLIFRSTKQNDGYGENPIGTTTDKTTYTDSDKNLKAGTAYFYKVRAVGAKGKDGREIFNESAPVSIIFDPAALDVNPKDLDFGRTTMSLPLTIKNRGGESLTWTISSDADWLTFKLAEGTSAPAKGLSGALAGKKESVITVTADRNRPDRLEPYTATITVTPNQGQPITVPTQMIIIEESEPTVNPATVDFGLERGLRTVEIGNAGTGKLDWTATSNEPWLQIKPKSGNGVTKANPDRLTLELVPTELDKLNPGPVSDTIIVRGAGKERQIKVSVEIPELPICELNLTSVDFGESRGSRTVEISNVGTGTLRWTARTAKNEKWLRAFPAQGNVVAGNQQSLTLEIVTTEADRSPPGEYSDTVIIECGEESKSITVKMRVPQPIIRISPNPIVFNPGETQKSMQIENIGEGVLVWSVDVNRTVGPVTVRPPSGATPAGRATEVRIEVDDSSLDAAEYIWSVPFTSNSSNPTCRVQFTKIGKITGTILDLCTNQLIRDATVSIPNQEFRTRADGAFALTYTQEGEYNVEVRADGYINRKELIPTRRGRGEKDIWLSPIARRVDEIQDPVRLITPKGIAFRERRAYVTNSIDNSVAVINTATDQVIAKIPLRCDALLCDPIGIAANPVRAQVYVAIPGADVVSVIDTNANEEVRQIEVGNSPVACAVTHDGRWLYVSNQRDNNVSVVDLDTLTAKDLIRVGREPAGMAISPDGIYLFVSNAGEDTVSVVDRNAGKESEFLLRILTWSTRLQIHTNPPHPPVYPSPSRIPITKTGR